MTQQIFESKRSTACYKLMAEERNTLFSSLYKEKLELNSSKKKTVEVFRNDVINPLKMKVSSNYVTLNYQCLEIYLIAL